jgi:hypothetical protein
MRKFIFASTSIVLLSLSGPSFADHGALSARAPCNAKLICVCSSGHCTCTRVLDEGGVSVY